MPPTKRATKSTANRTAKRRGPAKMTKAHKEALAVGREQSRHVGAYLEALEAHKPKRGRKRTPEGVRKRLAEVEAKMPTATGIKKLELAQVKISLQAELDASSVKVDLSQLRRNFVKHAKAYSDRKGISYKAWREAGVSAQDLRDAGITHTA